MIWLIRDKVPDTEAYSNVMGQLEVLSAQEKGAMRPNCKSGKSPKKAQQSLRDEVQRSKAWLVSNICKDKTACSCAGGPGDHRECHTMKPQEWLNVNVNVKSQEYGSETFELSLGPPTDKHLTLGNSAAMDCSSRRRPMWYFTEFLCNQPWCVSFLFLL